MSLAISFHFLCAQHVSDINISIIRSLRLFCWITTLVVLFLVRYVLQFQCGWVGVVSVLQASACSTDTTPTQPHRNSNTHRTKNRQTDSRIFRLPPVVCEVFTLLGCYAAYFDSHRTFGTAYRYRLQVSRNTRVKRYKVANSWRWDP